MIKKDSKLHQLAEKLIEAGFNYWEEYQKTLKPAAVVWLEMENGHFILFTRGEYKSQILEVIPNLTNEPPLEHVFEAIKQEEERDEKNSIEEGEASEEKHEEVEAIPD